MAEERGCLGLESAIGLDWVRGGGGEGEELGGEVRRPAEDQLLRVDALRGRCGRRVQASDGQAARRWVFAGERADPQLPMRPVFHDGGGLESRE